MIDRESYILTAIGSCAVGLAFVLFSFQMVEGSSSPEPAHGQVDVVRMGNYDGRQYDFDASNSLQAPVQYNRTTKKWSRFVAPVASDQKVTTLPETPAAVRAPVVFPQPATIVVNGVTYAPVVAQAGAGSKEK